MMYMVYINDNKMPIIDIEELHTNTIDWNMKQFDNYYQGIEKSVNTEMIEIEKTLLTHPQIVCGELKLETELKIHKCQIRTNGLLTSSLVHLENENGIISRYCNHIIVYIYKILQSLFISSKETQLKIDEIMLRLDKLERGNGQ